VQVITLTIPNATAAGTVITTNDTLDSTYQRCIGYSVHVISNPNSEPVQVAIDHPDVGKIHDFVPTQQLEPGTGAPMNQRYHAADFRAANMRMVVKGKPVVNLTADVLVSFVFLLSD
jgi:hypothetical protein